MTDRGKGDAVGSKWHPLAIAIISAMLGSSGGVALVYNTDIGQSITRPDPFTGSQGAALSTEVQYLKESVDGHLQNHPDGELSARMSLAEVNISRLQAQFELILANQDRIINRLDKK